MNQVDRIELRQHRANKLALLERQVAALERQTESRVKADEEMTGIGAKIEEILDVIAVQIGPSLGTLLGSSVRSLPQEPEPESDSEEEEKKYELKRCECHNLLEWECRDEKQLERAEEVRIIQLRTFKDISNAMLDFRTACAKMGALMGRQSDMMTFFKNMVQPQSSIRVPQTFPTRDPPSCKSATDTEAEAIAATSCGDWEDVRLNLNTADLDSIPAHIRGDLPCNRVTPDHEIPRVPDFIDELVGPLPGRPVFSSE